ncbi:secretion-regulating guanine nucleotide exchange factor isoform X2 [Poecilia latipinna]|uniref:Secretion regulating guanine nucleotide exchange factor n=1 Tax=Poecilia latipinna TaxID=48699 RepID=A0A3B3U2A1_9TELE|nr:PREDICTED: secretion-regulating guanine nucleotide exchange factor isoform X2 [Poecilia latipinna]
METHSRLTFCLYAWGANSYGQLGQSHVDDQCVPWLSVSSALQDRTVRVVDGGGGHSVVLTESGEVFVCGQNHRGQLGLGHSTDVSTLQLCPVLNHRVANVACGWDFTLLLTDSGQLLACGSNAFGQLGVGQTVTHSAELLAVETLKEPVVSVAAGLRHSLAVSASDSVYQWGTGLFSHAKRALSPHPAPSHLNSKLPCPVPGLGQRKARLVTAGSAHCVCLTEEGELFLWGSNKHGQLATAEPFLPSPSLLNRSLLKGEKVMGVCSGWTHVVAQTESGRVFTWGRGDYGQLGRSASVSENAETSMGIRKDCIPVEVTSLHGATQIVCGSEHNLAIVGGCLLSWGWNEHGMCGDGSQADVFHPRLVSDLRPVLIGCGAGHSMAVCGVTASLTQNSVHTWEELEHKQRSPFTEFKKKKTTSAT